MSHWDCTKHIYYFRFLKNIKDEGNSSIVANCDQIVTISAALINLRESIVY